MQEEKQIIQGIEILVSRLKTIKDTNIPLVDLKRYLNNLNAEDLRDLIVCATCDECVKASAWGQWFKREIKLFEERFPKNY